MSEAAWRETLFELFDKLIEVRIIEQTFMVPENNKLLRCFQFIKTETISIGDYCWNGDCVNCQIQYLEDEGDIKSALACKMYVKPGLIITKLSDTLRDDLAD